MAGDSGSETNEKQALSMADDSDVSSSDEVPIYLPDDPWSDGESEEEPESFGAMAQGVLGSVFRRDTNEHRVRDYSISANNNYDSDGKHEGGDGSDEKDEHGSSESCESGAESPMISGINIGGTGIMEEENFKFD